MRPAAFPLGAALTALCLAQVLAPPPSAAAPPPTASAPAQAAPGTPATGEALKHAETLFNRYIDLEHAFDPALIDLYAKEAQIESEVIVAGKPPRARKWTGATYKELLGRALKKAKETKQDLNYYSSIVYLKEGSRVRIKAMRYAAMQKTVSPVELLVGPDAGGTWRIYEERSETHPSPTGPQPVN
jgi:hypothetical protein